MDNTNLHDLLNEAGNALEQAIIDRDWPEVVGHFNFYFGRTVPFTESKTELSPEDALLEKVMQRLAGMSNITPQVKAPKVPAKSKKKLIPKQESEVLEPLAPLDFHNTAMVIQNAQPIQAKGAGSVKVTNYKPTVISTKASLSEQAILKATAEKADTKITRPETKPCMMTCTLCQKPFDFLKAYPGGKFGDSDIVRCNTCQTKG